MQFAVLGDREVLRHLTRLLRLPHDSKIDEFWIKDSEAGENRRTEFHIRFKSDLQPL